MELHPLVKILDVGDSVDDAAGTKNVSVLCKESRGDDAGLVFARLEVGIGEEEEEGGEGMLSKVVGEELHGVGANDGDVLKGGGVAGCVRNAQGLDAILNILRDLNSNFEAEHESIGEEGCEGDQETTKSTADICKLWDFAWMCRVVVSPVYIGWCSWIVEGMV